MKTIKEICEEAWNASSKQRAIDGLSIMERAVKIGMLEAIKEDRKAVLKYAMEEIDSSYVNVIKVVLQEANKPELK